MAIISVCRNALRPDEVRLYQFSGPFIEFLEAEFPDGFGGANATLVVDDEDIVPERWGEGFAPNAFGVLVLSPAGDPVTQFLIRVAISVAISALAVALAPKPPSFIGAPEPSPVYSVGIPGNASRLGGIVPTQYGAIKRSPDYAMQPYTEYDGRDEVLNAIFCVGNGYFDPANVELWVGNQREADLALGAIQYRLFTPDQHASTMGNIRQETGVHENVFTSGEVGGQALTDAAAEPSPTETFNATVSASVFTITSSQSPAALGLTSGLTGVTLTGYKPGGIEGFPDIDTETVTVTAIDNAAKTFTIDSATFNIAGYVYFELTIAAASDPRIAGPFTACLKGQTTQRLELDFEFPAGLYRQDGSGAPISETVDLTVRAELIDDDGNELGTTHTQSVTFTDDDNSPVRKSVIITLPSVGRWNVEVQRLSGTYINSSVTRMQWQRLKAFLTYTTGTVYGDVTLLSVRLRASDKLSAESVGRIQCRIPRLIPTHSGTVRGDNRTAADVIADVFRNAEYSIGLDAARLDQTAYAAFKTDEAAPINAVFDTETTVFDAARSVAESVFASIVTRGNLIGVDHDKDKLFPTRLFTDDNISDLKITSVVGEDGDLDGFAVVYLDPDTGDSTTVIHPTSAIRPERFQLFGCTDPVRAQLVAERLWRTKLLRHTKIEFKTGQEGRIPQRGERISVAYPRYDWGSAQLVRVASTANVTIEPGISGSPRNFTALVRDAKSTVHGPFSVSASGQTVTAVGGGNQPFGTTPFTDLQGEGVFMALSETGSDVIDVIVEELRPDGDGVRISGFKYDDRVYA